MRGCGRSCPSDNDTAGLATDFHRLNTDIRPSASVEIREDPWLLLAKPTSPGQLDALLRYAETREEHHRSCTFQEEYREFLRKHGVEYARTCVTSLPLI
jgi:hypothetical protein